ncbi:hypothetical protein AB0O87_01430 [Microbacterium sp. NPDC076768]|uniref:hypothetical protein n=1 Tax=Microbacterium sp. NPDC076768 TaxID=3154858 RepID=UPI003449FC6A
MRLGNLEGYRGETLGLFIGSLCILVFIVTRWTTEPFLNEFGFLLGLVGLGILGVSIGAHLTTQQAKKEEF